MAGACVCVCSAFSYTKFEFYTHSQFDNVHNILWKNGYHDADVDKKGSKNKHTHTHTCKPN